MGMVTGSILGTRSTSSISEGCLTFPLVPLVKLALSTSSTKG